MKVKKLISAALFGCFSAATVQAELLAPGFGRTANVDSMAKSSFEGALNLGSDIQYFGGRFNYKLSPDAMVYGDIGNIEFFDTDATAFGAGVIYQLRNVALSENSDFAVRASYHTADFDRADVTEIALNALISGDKFNDSSNSWYASAGLHFGEDDNEIGLSAGLVGDLAIGQWYAGGEFIDEFFFTGGIRYNFK